MTERYLESEPVSHEQISYGRIYFTHDPESPDETDHNGLVEELKQRGIGWLPTKMPPGFMAVMPPQERVPEILEVLKEHGYWPFLVPKGNLVIHDINSIVEH